MSLKFASFLLVLAVVLRDASPNACTDGGGTCKDWRQNICTAGYSTSDCTDQANGDPNIKCCLRCDATCEKNEQDWSNWDWKCEQMFGNCQINTNFCDCDCDLGTCDQQWSYLSGFNCDGPSNRQCCAPTGAIIKETTPNTKKTPTTVSAACYAFIKGYEKLVLTPYPDPKGSTDYAIGYGNHRYEDLMTLVKKTDPAITPARAEIIFTTWVDHYAKYVSKKFCSLTQPQLDALVSFVYNAGPGNFMKSRLFKAVKKNPNDPKTCQAFIDYGINLSRRQAEAHYYDPKHC